MMQQTLDVRVDDRRGEPASVVEAFELQVDANSERDAIRRPGRTVSGRVSFGQLDAWANTIAAELISRRGDTPEPVPLVIRRPELMLAAALGILKVGKFYAAVNPDHPAPHVRRILDELDAPLLLCDQTSAPAVPKGLHAVIAEELLSSGASQARPGLEFDEGRLAYVLYTSGSTGRPRGVAQSRRDLLHNVARHRPLAITDEDCVTLISADGFVASISNLYIALLAGAALAPYSFRDAGVDPMMDWLDACGVSVLYGFPSFLRHLAAASVSRVYDGLRLVYLGGETVLPADLQAALRLFPAATLSTGLNSSETGLTCLYTIPPGSPIPEPVPVGRPVLDIGVAIVSESDPQAKAGGCGEIEICSRYVRPRYWHTGGIRDGSPAPAFRTGDLGRIDSDGLIYHLGRVDQMVKVRGFRVDTTEVETAIAALPEIAEVAVFAAGEPPDVTLAACVVGQKPDIDPVAIRNAVARKLPAASIPARVLVVDEMPRTPNGKLDRARLADMTSTTDQGGNGSVMVTEPVLPRAQTDTEIERRIEGIWCSELEVERVDADQDFFALGGTSLTAVAVISRVRSELQTQVPLAALFRAPTVRALAATAIELQQEGVVERRVLSTVAVRPVQEGDLPAICAMVNHYIERTPFNFRNELQTPEEWLTDWSSTRSSYPWLTASVDGVMTGMAYAGRWKDRSAYAWCSEVTIYVAPDMQHSGIGRALYDQLLAMLDRQGYCTQIAVITLPNPASVAFHEALGFRHTGTLDGVGHKLGRWLDVGFWQRGKPQRDRPPTPIGPVPPG
jgi:acyl-coenzyme A synthetase/AMP-(fatty) acid ligase/L-amino acid N-acyltransferase YncA/acyl carrier protein